MGSIIVISGPVGAGKSTVAKALIRSAAPPAALIEGDDFWGFLAKPKPGRPANFQTIMRAMFRASAAIAADGYEAILDFSIPPYFLERAAARVAETPVHFVVLRPSVEVCAERAANRGEGTIADYGPYRDLYDLFDVPERHIVRNDETAASDVAAGIREGLASGRFKLG
ncbi:MAG TPA: AAA family ATPase [Caulobacteraceae bacterium]|nr:AAA family ATPase [Caulobacteraceae bacterium]